MGAAPARSLAWPIIGSYPAHREADVVLHSGASIRLRPLRPQDERALLAFLAGLSEKSQTFRFFSAGADLGAMAHRLADVDYSDRDGVLAIAGDGAVLGHGMGARGATSAEVAFEVAHELQGRGMATILLAHLA